MASSARQRQARHFQAWDRPTRRLLMLSMASSALLLAGCATGVKRPPPGPEPVAPSETVTARHGVALLVPLSGADGGVGQSIANAANLALLDSGEKSIRLTIYDTTKGGAAAVAGTAIADGNRLILGPLLAEDVRAAAPVARKAKVPVIAFSNDAAVAGDGVFILGVVPDQSIDRVVRQARAAGASRFAGLVPTGLYGQRAAQGMLGAVQRSGGRVTALQSFNRTPQAIRTAVRALNAKGGYDAVLIGDSGRISIVAAPLLKQGPSAAARILGTELWTSERTLGATPSLRGAWYAATPDDRFNQLVSRYRARYGKTPYRIGSLGYDAVLLTVRSAKRWSIGGAFPVRQLMDREGFAGVDGIFRFDRGGVAVRSLEIRQVTASGTTIISPAAKAFGD
ncbi:MAG TPA: penicillin-binding protein activator [Sphingomicrobium sp.]|nr:penicillin-binding protein activator [Sphingomicrobium sp.]